MASDLEFVKYVCDQAHDADHTSSRKMFGEYAVYFEGKVVAFVCDNQLYVKPTLAGRKLLDDVIGASPYPGAKNYFLINDALEDQDLMRKLFSLTSHELPEPKPKKKANKVHKQ